MLETLQYFDSELLNIFRESFLHFPWIKTFSTFFADLEPLLFSALLIGLWIYGVIKKDTGPKKVSLDLFWHVAAAFLIYWIINQLLPMRPRPETITSFPPLISHLPDNSFPSGHAIFWWASWWAIHLFLKKPQITWIFFFIWLLTVSARVLAGIHYPWDILVGFLLWCWLVELFSYLPHNERYRNLCHNIPLKIATFFRL